MMPLDQFPRRYIYLHPLSLSLSLPRPSGRCALGVLQWGPMADFPPDLEDGELWLPSDIIRDVGVRRPFSSSSSSSAAVAASPGCSAHLAYLEGIARQLDALCMLDRAGLLPAFGPPRHAPPHPRVSLRFPSLPFPSPLFGSS